MQMEALSLQLPVRGRQASGRKFLYILKDFTKV